MGAEGTFPDIAAHIIVLISGLTWEEALEQCPPGVVPACHNAEDSVTISGEENLVKGFVESLQEKGEFAKMVDSSGVAFHSHYMKQAAAPLKAALEKASYISLYVPSTEQIVWLINFCNSRCNFGWLVDWFGV